MEWESLSIGVVGYQQNVDENTYDFQIQVHYKMLKWDLYKRFSSFAQLRTDLLEAGYVATCGLPPKTLLVRALDKVFVDKRTQKLDQFLKHLIMRPDTRSSHEVMDFLKITEHTNIPADPLKLELVGKAVHGSGRMAVSALDYNPVIQILAVALEDNTSLCKLGKVWSLVESECTGCISLHTISGDLVSQADMDKLSDTHLIHRCRAICVSSEHKRVFAGLDDGSVAVLDVPPAGSLAVPTNRIEVHTEAIVCFAHHGNHLLSVAYDASIRLIDTGTTKIISGGRLSKRLRNGDDLLTAAALCGYFSDRLIALLGTSSGDLLVFRVDTSPPEYMDTVQIDKGNSILAVVTQDSTVIVGHAHNVSCWSLKLLTSNKQQQLKLVKRAHFSVPASIGYDSAVSSIAIDAAARRLIAGYQSGAILLWSLSCGACIMAMQAHAQKVSCVQRIAENVYITGSDEGNAKNLHDTRVCVVLLIFSVWLRSPVRLVTHSVLLPRRYGVFRASPTHDGKFWHQIQRERRRRFRPFRLQGRRRSVRRRTERGQPTSRRRERRAPVA
eukprot:GHVS01107988.1.p1 GENE.GHVS01107988.1~~GHVS01107988.1.p1  ORF type:complete len:555 (-),score=50.59 GHVS01107988.1:769-2433(-)